MDTPLHTPKTASIEPEYLRRAPMTLTRLAGIVATSIALLLGPGAPVAAQEPGDKRQPSTSLTSSKKSSSFPCWILFGLTILGTAGIAILIRNQEKESQAVEAHIKKIWTAGGAFLSETSMSYDTRGDEAGLHTRDFFIKPNQVRRYSNQQILDMRPCNQ